MGELEVAFEPHPINAGFLRAFAEPFIEVDGTVTPASWSAPTTVDLTPGRHNLRTFIRYRRLVPGDLGSGSCAVDVPATGTVHVVARNGVMNQTPFTPAVVSEGR